MTSVKCIGLDAHKESISICVRNSVGKVVMESVIETKASTILQFIDGLRGDLRVTFEEGTWATWLIDDRRRKKIRLGKGRSCASVRVCPMEKHKRFQETKKMKKILDNGRPH